MSRQVFLVFYGEARWDEPAGPRPSRPSAAEADAGRRRRAGGGGRRVTVAAERPTAHAETHPHESPWIMTVPAGRAGRLRRRRRVPQPALRRPHPLPRALARAGDRAATARPSTTRTATESSPCRRVSTVVALGGIVRRPTSSTSGTGSPALVEPPCSRTAGTTTGRRRRSWAAPAGCAFDAVGLVRPHRHRRRRQRRRRRRPWRRRHRAPGSRPATCAPTRWASPSAPSCSWSASCRAGVG